MAFSACSCAPSKCSNFNLGNSEQLMAHARNRAYFFPRGIPETETNSLHLKHWDWKMSFLFGARPPARCFFGFWECKYNLKSVKLNIVGFFYRRIRLWSLFGGHCWGLGTSGRMWSKWWIYINIISKPHVLFLEHLNSLCETQVELDTSLSYHLNKYSYFIPLHFSNLFNVKRTFSQHRPLLHIYQRCWIPGSNNKHWHTFRTISSWNSPTKNIKSPTILAPKTSNGNKHVSLLTCFGNISFLFQWRRYVSCPGPFMSDSFPIHFTYHFFNLQHLLVGVFNPS